MNQNNQITSQALAAKIVVYRALGIFKEEAKKAMVELSRRKEAGDDFDYDKYISDKLDEIPKSNLNQNIINFLSTISNIGNTR